MTNDNRSYTPRDSDGTTELKPSPAAFTLRGAAESSTGSTTNTSSQYRLMSQSFGGDPSPLLRSTMIPPSSTGIQRYSSASSGLSSISYSGYLYKRSNCPHRNPEMSSSSSPSQQRPYVLPEEEHAQHQQRQQHQQQYAESGPVRFFVDPDNVPALPSMPGMYAAAPPAAALESTISGKRTMTPTATMTDNEHDNYHPIQDNVHSIDNNNKKNSRNYYFLSDHQWPDFQSPLAYEMQQQQQQQRQDTAVASASSMAQSSSSVDATTRTSLVSDNEAYRAVVTPSPVNTTTMESNAGQSDPQQEQQNLPETKQEKNPIQLGIESAAAFFGIRLGGGENRRPDKEDPNPSTPDHHDSAATTTAAATATAITDTTTPVLSTTIQQRKTSSSPIKMPGRDMSTTPPPSSIIEPPATRRAIPIPQSNLRQSFHEANHRRHSAPNDMQTPPDDNNHNPNSPLEMMLGSSASPSSSSNGHKNNYPHKNGVPQDFYDPRDGHLWRAKYCVLEDGVLYFYRNATDGESVEAAAERKRTNMVAEDNHDGGDGDNNITNGPSPSNTASDPRTIQHKNLPSSTSMGQRTASTASSSSSLTRRRGSVKDLSKSPMVRPTFHHFDSSGASENSQCMWEKRVFMDCVGGVRTAEQQFGKNSFELIAVDDEDFDQSHVDTLVLQAPNPAEMREWIFQFHRSLASFLRNIMDIFGSTSSSGAFLDIHHPTSMTPPPHSIHHTPLRLAGSIPHSPSDKQLHRMLASSPRFHHLKGSSAQIQQTLSHGHGRTALRRRTDLKRTPSDGGSLSSTPDVGDGDSPQHQFAFREPSPSNLRFTPETITPPPEFLVPPPTTGAATGFSSIEVATSTPSSDEPELSGPAIQDPETERPKPATGRYIPPHLRNKQQSGGSSAGQKSKYVPPHLRRQQEGSTKKYIPPHLRKTPISSTSGGETLPVTPSSPPAAGPLFAPMTPTRNESPEPLQYSTLDNLDVVGPPVTDFVRGGCADPNLIEGSILDRKYIPRKASRVGKMPAVAFGSYGGGKMNEGDIPSNNEIESSKKKSSLRWEMGAVSECGVRNSNEDAFLVANDLLNAFQLGSFGTLPQTFWTHQDAVHSLGLFAIFDGHCGNEAARFAVERLGHFIHEELVRERQNSVSDKKCGLDSPLNPGNIESILHDAILKMDDEFCTVCQEDGRQWESGATALVAMIANENLVIGNLGDCRGILCRFVEDTHSYEADEDWYRLENLPDGLDSSTESKQCFWREVTNTHTPSAEKERERIEKANGWITTETEIPIGQLRRMDLLDEDVIGILKRCLHYTSGNTMAPISDSERSTKEFKAAPQRILHISRVCGELAVSRALGDRDFKAAFNTSSNDAFPDSEAAQQQEVSSEDESWWDCPLWLPYPDDQKRRFQGDLVSNTPDFQRIKVGENGVSDEFLLLACDGLWDVMDTDDAVRVVRDLLFHKKWTAKKAAARLAELAIHLGSSDNVTVILIRLFSREDELNCK